ncbi:MAG TPA: hypothetical protein VHX86_19250 [Tepidisphaeraceae bacterium]|nr:hypothetical protein [Tepidisphaeraceae bacterium]
MESLEARVLLSATSNVQLSILATPAAGVSGSPSGLSPAMIEQAYDLKNIVFTTGGQTVSANGDGETIAIVDAFGDPDIVNDLETFDANFGISDDNGSGQFALTVATPEGSVSTNAGWASEESLDVEWAHAIAPAASIVLVEAPSASVAALTDAVSWARSQTGVVAVSMSWGDSPEFSGETAYDTDFTTTSGHEGVTFVAASGDDSAPNYPSTSTNVLAVGGTTLDVDSSGDFISESPWVDSGGGHSPYEGTNKPDVAYDGDPSTGFLVYDSLPYQGESGWQVVGGTSAGSPQWSAIIALVDQGRALRGLGSLDGATQTISDIYGLPSGDFNPVSSGGLTGLGSPDGEKVISDLVGGGITSVNSSFADGADQLAIVQQPGSTSAHSVISHVVVDVEDSGGSVVTADNSNVTISVATGPGALAGTLTVAAVDGVATFSNLSLNTAGTYTLRAADGTLIGATSDSFVISPGAASQLGFVQRPTTAWAYAPITPAVEVALEDAYGNPITSGRPRITLTISGNSATVPGGPFTATAVNGIASFSGFSFDAAGSYDLQASDGSMVSQSVSLLIVAPPTERFLFNGVGLSTAAIASQERRVAAHLANDNVAPASASRTDVQLPAINDQSVFAKGDVVLSDESSMSAPFVADDLILTSIGSPQDLLNES